MVFTTRILWFERLLRIFVIILLIFSYIIVEEVIYFVCSIFLGIIFIEIIFVNAFIIVKVCIAIVVITEAVFVSGRCFWAFRFRLVTNKTFLLPNARPDETENSFR